MTALALACSRAPDRGPDDADRARLGALLAADAKVDAFLGEADRLDRAGRGAEAASLVEGDAARAVTEARGLLGRTTVETPWGRARREDLDKLLVDRAAAMPGYAAALRGGGPRAKVDALVAQAAHEKRALAIAAAVRAARASP